MQMWAVPLRRESRLRSADKAASFIAVKTLRCLPQTNKHKVFDGLSLDQGIFTSKDSLPLVVKASKAGMCSCRAQPPELCGNVIVLGAGDIGLDCASSALGSETSRELAREEKCSFLPSLSPREVVLKKGHAAGLLFCRIEQLDDGSWIEDEE
ncbi:hypothetical protein MHYP_G00202260 [Metynnis hypsauchen]